MLFKREILDRIRAGEVTLAFRRWRRPTVKSGGRLRTAVGELAIERVSKIEADAISDKDAQRAGFPGRTALLAELSRREGDVYRIELRFAGADAFGEECSFRSGSGKLQGFLEAAEIDKWIIELSLELPDHSIEQIVRIEPIPV